MGLASLFLGDQNPFSQWTTQNSNLLGSIGAGVASGTNLGQGLANAAQYVPQGRQLDVTAKAKLDADAKTAQLATQAEALKSKYADFFNQNGQPDYARAVADGLVEPGAAYLEWMKGKQGGGAAKPIEINGQLVDPNTYQVLGDFRTPEAPPKAPAPPTSFQEFQLAKDNPDYAATLSSSTSKPPTDSQRRASQLTEAIKPDASLLLGDGTTPGAFDALANGWDQMGGANIPFVGGAPLKGLTSSDYQRANNAIVNIAQSYLYAVSGAAAPAAEVDKIVRSVTPQFGEDPKSVADKKVRLKQYIDAIALGQQNGGVDPGAASSDPLGIR